LEDAYLDLGSFDEIFRRNGQKNVTETLDGNYTPPIH
jgi:hypothetical protein